MDNISKFSFPTDISFGLGASSMLAAELLDRNLLKPLVVTDKFLAETELMRSFCNNLSRAGLEVSLFGGVFGNPSESQVSTGKSTFHNNNCDCIVALGGGASIDVAKAIGLLVSNPGSLSSYDSYDPRCQIPKNPLPFLVALPTTAGTGSEVGRSTVISDNKSKIKKVIFHPYLLPKLVILDPILTESLPAKITAATGMDAFTHHIEAFLVNDFHPMCDGIALEGLHLIAKSLVLAFTAAKNDDLSHSALEHRANMLASSMMGAVAFQKGLGLNHSLAHALSTVSDIHHGLANAIMLPHSMGFNAPSCGPKFARILRALNVPESLGLVDFIKQLNIKLEIETHLQDHGVNKAHIADLVTVAFNDSCHRSNPKVVSKEDMRTLFLNAL